MASEAWADVDIRVLRLRDAPGLERKFKALRPVDKRCSIEVTGGLNGPPMERSAGIVTLFREGSGTGEGNRRGTGRVADRRRIGREFHRRTRKFRLSMAWARWGKEPTR